MSARWSGIAQAVIATAAGIALLYFLRDILVPFILALVLAILVNALVRFICNQSQWATRWASVLVGGLLVLLCAVVTAIIFVQGAAQMIKQAPQLFERLDQIVMQIGQSVGLQRPLHLATLTGSINVPQLAGNLLGSVGSFFSGLLLMITYFIFMLAGRRHVDQKFERLAENVEGGPNVQNAARQIADDIETYLWVQTVTGVMIGAASALAMFSVGLDHTIFWTIVLFLLCYIPIIGVTVGSVVPALFALLQFPTWWQAAVVFGVIQAVAFIVGNFIYPKMQAETQNIDPVATLLSLAFWGYLWGLTGAFLAVPLTLIVMMICAHFPRARWVAILLSNDGRITFPGDAPKKKRRRSPS
jgi:predicted PurR-regulated permease PerM